MLANNNQGRKDKPLCPFAKKIFKLDYGLVITPEALKETKQANKQKLPHEVCFYNVLVKNILLILIIIMEIIKNSGPRF